MHGLLFDSAKAEHTDAVYEPVALLGEQQDVYCILCRAMVDDEDAEPYYTLVYVGKNGVQNIWDLWVETHSVPEQRNEDAERMVDISTLLTDLASDQEARNQVTADMKALENNELAVFIVEKWNEIYFSPDYRLYIDGKDDPAALPIRGNHAFVVLGFELENGEMQDELKARCEAAAKAAETFPASILVCSGGATGENNPEGHTEAGLMKEYLVQNCGIAPERVYIDESAMTTLDNAVNTFTILKNQGIDTITIVTSSYHQRRANILYETLAEVMRRTEGVSITVAGNYSCEAQAPDELEKYDARIAAMQLNEILMKFQPEE
jgi:vancomycin permeability regulator SanA